MGIRRTNPRIRIWIIPTFIFLFLGIQQADAHGSEQGVACFMAVTGLGMSTIWTMDMVKADKIDVSNGYLFAKEQGSDSYLLPHWIAEYSTAGLLIAGGYGLYKDEPWARECVSACSRRFELHSHEQSWLVSGKARPFGLCHPNDFKPDRFNHQYFNHSID